MARALGFQQLRRREAHLGLKKHPPLRLRLRGSESPLLLRDVFQVQADGPSKREEGLGLGWDWAPVSSRLSPLSLEPSKRVVMKDLSLFRWAREGKLSATSGHARQRNASSFGRGREASLLLWAPDVLPELGEDRREVLEQSRIHALKSVVRFILYSPDVWETAPPLSAN